MTMARFRIPSVLTHNQDDVEAERSTPEHLKGMP